MDPATASALILGVVNFVYTVVLHTSIHCQAPLCSCSYDPDPPAPAAAPAPAPSQPKSRVQSLFELNKGV